jgi:hypothetical protein
MKGLLVYKNILDVSIDWKNNNGKSVAFWTDRWFHNTTLSHTYPYLFSIVTNTDISVAEAFVNN